jgi:transglutaminase-like putative cysteine protease
MTTNLHSIPAQAAPPPADTPAERLARGGGWWTLILALIMLTAMTEALNAAAWSEGLEIVRLAVLGGALLAFLLSLTRWDGFFPAFYGFLASLFWVSTLFNAFIFTSLTAQEGVQELVQRNGQWLYALMTGKASADNLIFVTQLAFLGWWIGYLAIWSLMRHQRLALAIIPAGVGLLVNAYFAPDGQTGYIILYLVSVLLLAIRVELARNETRWQIARVRYAPDIALDFLKAGLIFSVAVIALAFTVPNLANSLTMQSLTRPFEEPWHTVRDTWQRMYKALNYGSATTRVAEFGKIAPLGGPVALTDRPIFEADAPERVYWRAATYDTYTGQGWLNTDSETLVIERNQPLGEPSFAFTREITTTIRPLEVGQEIIFGAPSPVRVSVPVSAEAAVIPGGSGTRMTSLLHSRVSLNRDRGYQVVSARSEASPDRLRADNTDYPQWIRDRYLQLPETVPFRVKDLAAKITAAYANPYDKAEAVEAVLRTYKYNQGIAGPPEGADGVDYFLFDIKEGYCDYYASAMVVMLRSVGIPARFVGGYTPGQSVPKQEQTDDGLIQYRVLERNAHAWPEVYFPSYGWIQFEPTASEPTLVRPAPESQPLDAGLRPDNPIDAGDNTDLPPDRGLPAGLAQQPATGGLSAWLAKNWGWLALALGLIAGAVIAWRVARRRQATLFREEGSLGRLFDLLEVWAGRLRIPWLSSHTPLEHAAEFSRKLPEATTAVDGIASLFVAQQYGRQQPAPEMLAGVAGNWQAIQPKLWRRWFDEIVGTPKRKQ